MADNAPRLKGDPFLEGEPSTHPAYGEAATANAAPATGPTVSAQFVGGGGGASSAPGSAMAIPASTAPPPVPPPDVFNMTDPTGQGGQPPPELRPPIAPSTYTDLTKPVPLPTTPPADLTKYPTADLVDPMNPPTELFGSKTAGQMVKTGMVTAGAMLGGAAGVPAGGGVADIVTVPAGAYLGGVLGGEVYDTIQNLTEALSGQTNEQGEPITLGQQTIDALMNGTISLAGGWGQAIGGEVANAVGKVVGPLVGKSAAYVAQGINALGRIGGGGAGTAAGTLAAEGAIGASAGVAKVWGLLPPDARTPEMLQSLKDAYANGGLDMIVNGVFHVPMGLKPFVRASAFKVFGITPEMITNAEIARGFGIPLGMNNVANKSTLATLIRTVTSVIPLVGHPYRDLENKQIAAINTYSQDLSGRVANPSTAGLPTVEQAGTDTRARANEAFKRVAQTYNDRFDLLSARAKVKNVRFSLNAKGGIDADGNSVPSLKKWADGVLAVSRKGDLPQYREMPDGSRVIVKPAPGKTTNKKIIPTSDILTLAADIKNAPDVMTVDELEKLGKRAEKIFTDHVEPGDKSDASISLLGTQIENFNKSLHGAFTDSFDADPHSKSFPAIGEDYLKLDKEYAAARKMFENATGAKLSKSSVKLPADVLGDTLFSTMDSPTQIDDLRKIVGDKVMNDGAATFLQNIVSTATKDAGTPKQSFNVEDFATAIGADNSSSNRYQAVSKALQTSGVKMQDLLNFVKAARLSGQNQPPGLATMLVRKMTFGGFGSIVKTLVPIAAAEAGHSVFGPHVGALGTAGGVLLSWKAADIMTNPMYLRDATTFMNPAVGEAERRMALWRVAKAVLPADQWQTTSSDNKGTGKTPPKTIEDRVRQSADIYFEGSTFLNKALTQPGSLAQ